MGSVEEKTKPEGIVNGAHTNLLEEMKLLKEFQDQSGIRKAINSELWYACAGPLVSLPQVGSLVYYFPQGHSEQVAVSTKRSATSQIPNYPNLPSQLLCQVHNVTLHADKDTDEIYAQMSLQPVNSEKDVFPIPDFGLKPSKHPSEFFCKTLTASDTSTHGGFSVPRRAAEKLFPPLDFSMQPPSQELVVRDLHDNTWTFRHIYRGQPKRHLLTTGWSLFVGSKRLKAGDSVLFIRNEKSQLMVGVRRANRQQATLPSSVLSADSMHIGVLAAAAHAAGNRSPFTIFYNPRACPSDFVIPLIKFRKAVFGTQVSAGMRFGMMFETEESGKRRPDEIRRCYIKFCLSQDFSMQPPSQELVVRDLHDNTWTFRHIYRGQPKRHLLTTGWSLFVGSKRLKAGDSVLFIRNEKSQLMVGVRRANRQQTTLPSSVLSADSMHIGVLAAAAHAAGNRSPFTIFYNPRACPSDFVIPLIKFRKAVFGTQVSAGMRFGMMFETEESGKRRYMGTIVGVSDLDPLRWPGSKWRNLQVEWDEPGCSDRQNRVSSWEIETPESLFIFPSLTSGLKRPLQSGFLGDTEWGSMVKKPLAWFPGSGNANLPYASMSNIYSEQLVNMLMKPQAVNYPGICGTALPEVSALKVASLDVTNVQAAVNHTSQLNQSGITPIENQNYSQICLDQSNAMNSSSSKERVAGKSLYLSKVENQAPVGITDGKLKAEPEHLPDQLSQLTSTGECIVQKPFSCPMTQQNATNHLVFQNQNQGQSQLQTSLWPMQALPESPLLNSQQIHASLADATPNCSLPFLDADEWISHPNFPMSIDSMYRSGPLPMFGLQDPMAVFPETTNPSLPFMNQDAWDHQMSNLRILSQANQLIPLAQQEPCSFNSGAVKDLSDESNDQSGIYGSLNIDTSNGGGSVYDRSVSSAILDEFCTFKDADLKNASDCLVGNLSSSQDVQSQITSASLADSQAFSRQDFPDNSGGTSSSKIEFDNSNLLHNNSWQQVAPRMRTYTKVQKTGSVGRSIDVSSLKNYEQLCSAIERMFGLNGLLNNPKGSGWKLVYVDYENDVLLIGDDPWEEFIGCVRCIRILSPSEVQQMSEEGMKLLNSANIQGTNALITEDIHA